MKTLFILASIMSVLFLAAPNKVEAQKKTAAKTIVGTISGYECGDNCYLTITDNKGKEHVGLCTARPLCTKWNADTEMPNWYKGKKVRVTIGRGIQLDGSGNVMGKMDAFTGIQFLTTRTSVSAQPSAENWFVILGSFPKSQLARANQRLKYVRSLGYEASIVDTDNYAGLRDGFYSVVLGPYSKSDAKRFLRSIRPVIHDAYAKSGDED